MSAKVPKHIKNILSKYSKDGIVRIDLGCGGNKIPGFIGIDYRKVPGVDIVQDLEETPWALPDACATQIICGHVVEHINPAKFGFIKFMDECWRILKYDGEIMISTPYAGSRGYWADPTHCNPCAIETWAYFDPLHALKGMYEIYKPKPWKVQRASYQLDGNMEVVLQKRRIDQSYGLGVGNAKS